MKREKIFGIINKEFPENQWEAEYMNTNTGWEVIMMSVVFLCTVAFFIAFIFKPEPMCHVELQGDAAGKIMGNLQVNSYLLHGDPFDELQIKRVEGKAGVGIVVDVPCSVLKQSGFPYSDYKPVNNGGG